MGLSKGELLMSVGKLEKVEKTIEGLLQENRIFEPSLDFTAQANVQDKNIYEEAAGQEAFWAKQAERLDWFGSGTQC